MSVNNKFKPLAKLRNSAKGAIDHLEIRPAKNSRGGKGFITRIHRHPAPAAVAAMAKGGPYTPPPPPEEVPHEDGQDMLDHVGRTFGVKPDDGDGADAEPDDDEAA